MVRTKVFVGNLSFQTKEAELAAEFGAAGKVISANIITRGPRSLGYGFVEMDSEEDADNAVQVMNKKEINGRPINVEIAKPQVERKENVPRQSKEGGDNEDRPRRPRRRNNDRRRQGEGEDEKAETRNDKQEEGTPTRPRRRPRNRNNRTSLDNGQRRAPDEPKEESKTTLFVANLPFSLGAEEFAKIVTDHGLKLKTAHVVKKRNGRSKGYGFIEFETQDDQQKALGVLNKTQVEGRELSVKIALTEIKRENEETKETKESRDTKPVEKKPASPSEKKAVPVEKKAVPTEKKAVPVEKKAVPIEKKASPPTEKKLGSPAEKKAASPAEKKVAPTEKKAATPEKEEKI